MFYITFTVGLLLMVLSLKDSSSFIIVVIFAISAPITYWLVQGWRLHLLRKQAIEDKS